jgi:phage baseplate assembly protein W
MNLLDRFKKTIVGSKGTIGDFTSAIISSGDFNRITDIQVILNSWSNILLTPTKTYDHDPEYGSNLYKMIFEPCDDQTKNKIKNEIYNKLSKYDDRASIQEMKINYLTNKKGFVVDIIANYKGQKSEVRIVIDESIYFRFIDNFP